MSVVAHIGPSPSSSGGPAGYLRQLCAAFEGVSPEEIGIFFPRCSSESATPRTRTTSSALAFVQRWKRSAIGTPRFNRPDIASVRQRGGALETLFQTTLAEMHAEIEASLASAIACHADVLFAHSLAAGEAALAARTGEQVWLMLHAPMPLGLYLAWSWSVPEIDWEE